MMLWISLCYGHVWMWIYMDWCHVDLVANWCCQLLIWLYFSSLISYHDEYPMDRFSWSSCLACVLWYCWFMRFWFHEKEFMVGFHLEHPRGGSGMWFWFGLWKLIYWHIDDYWRCFGMCMPWLAMWAGSMWYPSHLWLGVGWDLYILILSRN
jgi:hypothetical protein